MDDQKNLPGFVARRGINERKEDERKQPTQPIRNRMPVEQFFPEQILQKLA